MVNFGTEWWGVLKVRRWRVGDEEVVCFGRLQRRSCEIGGRGVMVRDSGVGRCWRIVHWLCSAPRDFSLSSSSSIFARLATFRGFGFNVLG